MLRIASLLSSGTEITCALGFEKSLVARSHECDFPQSIEHLPVATETKFNPDGTSYQIDQRVKAILQEGLSVYRVKGELLRALDPNVIITQIQCEVCAVSRKDVEEATYAWTGSKPKIVSLNPNSLQDIWEDIRAIARALNAPENGERLISSLQARIKGLEAQAHERTRRPRVACVEWIDPLMAAGNWVPELISLANGISLFGQAGRHSPWMTWTDLKSADPDIIVVLPCGWGIERSSQEMPTLEKLEGWSALKAVRNRNVYLADGNQYFNRPGPRIVESLEILTEIFQDWVSPQAARYTARPAWRKWSSP